MKIKPKSVKSTILIVVVVVALIAASRFLGIGTLRSVTRIGYIGNEGWQNWSGSYTLLDGNMTRTIRPEGDTLAVAVETKSGTISIEIKDADGNVIFDEDNIGTETFNVDVWGNGYDAFFENCKQMYLITARRKIIVLAYPIYFSNLPKFVRDFIVDNRTLFARKSVFIIATMGLFSGDGAGCSVRLLQNYGAKIVGGLHLKMPDCIGDTKALKNLWSRTNSL